MRKRVIVSRNRLREKSSTTMFHGDSRVESHIVLPIEEQMAECRHALENGRCVYIGDRWFSSDISQKDSDHLIATYNRRLDKNRRQREYSARIRAKQRLEEMIASLPPWVQSRRFGRTAVVTKKDGEWSRVDYGKTYCRQRDIPLPVPGDFVVDWMSDIIGSIATKLSRRLKPIKSKKEEMFAKGPLPIDPMVRTEVERHNRLRAERRKCIRRSTCAECPTATDVRVAWQFRRERDFGVLRLGALLLDLECYVDNSIRVQTVATEDGSEISLDRDLGDSVDHRAEPEREPVRIRGRNPGVRGWIQQNCPELNCRYKTLMRYKSAAARLCQAMDVPDPVPLSAVIDSNVDIAKLWANGIREQPRPEPIVNDLIVRFAWEQSAWERDADGRLFRNNPRYRQTLPFTGGYENFRRILDRARKNIMGIIAVEPDSNVVSTIDDSYSIPPRCNYGVFQIVERRIDFALKRRELWWRESA